MFSHETKDEMNTFNNKQEFIITQDNVNIKTIISYNDKLMSFELKEENIFPKKEYHKITSLDELIKIDKIFRLFDSLEEVLDFFKKIITNKNLSIIKENENEIKLKIYNSLFENYFFINIPLKKPDIKTEMNNITQYIISLNNKINELEKKVNENKKEINELKNYEKEFKEFKEKITADINILKKDYENNIKEKIIEINQIKENSTKEINEFKIKINEMQSIVNEYDKLKKIQIEKDNFLLKNSNIVKFNEQNIIDSWFDKKPTKFNLLFDSRKDGDAISTIDSKCAKKCPKIVFIKTTKGYRFGSFTTIFWPKNDNTWGYDENSFLFSLDTKSKYKAKDKYSVLNQYNNDLYFGNGDIDLSNNFTNKTENNVNKSSYDIPSQYELNGGEKNFTVLCCEIYQIEF